MGDVNWREVTEALSAAVSKKTDLSVIPQPELNGAMAISSKADVYVMSTQRGLAVECWRDSDCDPYKIVMADGLREAIWIAMDEL